MNQNKTLGFVFPGQGSQFVGMLNASAQSFPIIEDTFTQASEILKKDLWALAQNGPESLLNSTVNTQPILLTAGVALWRLWIAKKGPYPQLLAGHSLGEYTALVCAGSLDFADAVRLVSLRGEFMQEAVPAGVGAMAAVIGVDDKILEEVCKEAAESEIVSPANYNAVGQTVIAGNVAAVERASILAKARGAKKIIPLPVSVPSHCALMKEAANKLAKELSSIKIVPPKLAVIHNVDVDTCDHPDDIRQRLVEQLYLPVRWVETIQRFSKEGIQSVIECGPGKVLSGLIKRIDPNIKSVGIEAPSELETAIG